MNPASAPRFSRASSFLLAFIVSLAAACTTGCGGGSTTHLPGTPLSGNTSVLVLASSTANDQLSQFDMVLNNVTLSSQSGKTVNLFAAPLHAEFIHVNGTAEPLLTVSVPQDIYTSATASIGVSRFACVNLNSSGGLEVSHFADAETPSSSVTVDLPSPITITGANMGLSLDLLVSKSASLTSCDPSGIEPYSVTPTFSLTSLTFSSQPTNATNGKLAGLTGQIGAVDAAGGNFAVVAADGPSCVVVAGVSCPPDSANGPSWQIMSSASTVYQGIAGDSDLAGGMPVDMDVVIQGNGSLLATRVAVEQTNFANLTVSSGPLLFVSEAWPALNVYGREGWGPLLTGGADPFSFGNAVFQISDQFTNLKSLPFSASFNAATMVAGQNVVVSTHALNYLAAPAYAPAATMSLIPQTVNGNISAVSSDGSFTKYTVVLAAYDLFPNLAVQGGQTTLLKDPGTVVYADSNTQMLNTDSLGVGSSLRFNGLIFNDNGTLRMDCAQINDGVIE
jgi:hypothetical protein